MLPVLPGPMHLAYVHAMDMAQSYLPGGPALPTGRLEVVTLLGALSARSPLSPHPWARCLTQTQGLGKGQGA